MRLGTGLVLFLVAALWIGAGRGNDGGWYLYHAREALAGVLPYRDLPFPHPPLAWLPFLPAASLPPGLGPLLGGRLTSLGLALAGLALGFGSFRRESRPGVFLGLLLCLGLQPYTVYFLSLVKAYGPACFLLGAALFLRGRGHPGGASFVAGLAASSRLSLGILGPWFWIDPSLQRGEGRNLAGFLFGLLLGLSPALLVAPGGFLSQLYLPLVFAKKVNSMTDPYVLKEVGTGVLPWLGRVLGCLPRLAWTHALWIALGIGIYRQGGARDPVLKWIASAALALSMVHFLARRPYDDYQLVLLPLVFAALGRSPPEWLRGPLGPRRIVGLLLLTLPNWMRALPRLELRPVPALLEYAEVGARLAQASQPRDTLLTLDPYLAITSGRRLPSTLALGRFGLLGTSKASQVQLESLLEDIRAGRFPVLALPRRDPLELDPIPKIQRSIGAPYVARRIEPDFGEQRVDLWIFVREESP